MLFSQGEPAAAVFYILKGTVKRVVVSKRGREAVIALLGPGAFFGEGCLTGQRRRTATATAVTHCTVVRLEKGIMIRLLQEQPGGWPGFSCCVLTLASTERLSMWSPGSARKRWRA